MDNLLQREQVMKPDKNQIWNQVLGSVKVSVSSAVFSTWICKTHLVSLKKKSGDRYIAEIGCLSSFVKATIESRYFGIIQDSLTSALGFPCDLVFVIKQPESSLNTNKQVQTPLFEIEMDNGYFVERLNQSRIRPSQVFENYAVSSSNQMAWAACDAVSKNPGSSYNPLFIWGGVGVGKTHLMNAVGYSVLKKNTDFKVLLCTGEDFTNDIVMGIRNKTTQNVREKYRKLKCLFVDDIQFIAGKDAAQEEFFHTFNAVTGAGGQVILTSDKPPHQLMGIEERLRSRFEAGLIVDVGNPDFELRCAITSIKAQEKGLDLEMNYVSMISGNLDSPRKIEGFLIKLSSELKFRHVEISEEFVSNLLGREKLDVNGKRRIPTPEAIIDAVSTHFSVNKKALMGPARARMVARPRQILMYLLRSELHMPFADVGGLIGGRDHSTVMHAVTTITKLSSMDPKLREDILGIKSAL